MIRIIPRLDVKGSHLIKGIGFEGLRKLGDPLDFAIAYAAQGAHELFFLDAVASLYGRNNLLEVVSHVSQELFVPLTVGGGISNVSEAEEIYKAGADKIAVNSAVVRRPDLIDQLVTEFGSQSVMLSVEAKRAGDKWYSFTEFGREPSDKEVSSWVSEAVDRGVGEVCLTSIDFDGRRRGVDRDLINSINWISVPLIYSGGVSSIQDLDFVMSVSNISALCIGSALHYGDIEIEQLLIKAEGKVA